MIVVSADSHPDTARKSRRHARCALILFHGRSCPIPAHIDGAGSRTRGVVEAPGVEPGSEDRPPTGMGMITQPHWWSAQAQIRGGLPGRECFGHQFLR